METQSYYDFFLKARPILLQIKNLKEVLNNSSALFVLMSGSGSTMFAVFENKTLAEKVMNKFKSKYFSFLQNS